jgi:hypothetical protein
MKKIVFEVVDDSMQLATEHPVPAISMLPNWYKNMDSLYQSRQVNVENGTANRTAKMCIPMRDAIGAGYFILLNVDIVVRDGEEGKEITWAAQTKAVDRHASWQIEGMPVPEGFDPKPFKWMNTMRITTPKGYSCLFIHPMNRPELPFHILSGVVDTDKFDLPINFPFFIKRGFTGVIPAGTPIAQVIPIRRESWKSKFVQSADNAAQVHRSAVRLGKHLYGAYSKYYWTKKEYR